MQNSLEFDFNKILDQTLYTYTPEKLSLQEYGDKSAHDRVANATNPWSSSLKYGLVKKLWPMCIIIGILEIIVGASLLVILVLRASEYDKLFATEDTKGKNFFL